VKITNYETPHCAIFYSLTLTSKYSPQHFSNTRSPYEIWGFPRRWRLALWFFWVLLLYRIGDSYQKFDRSYHLCLVLLSDRQQTFRILNVVRTWKSQSKLSIHVSSVMWDQKNPKLRLPTIVCAIWTSGPLTHLSEVLLTSNSHQQT